VPAGVVAGDGGVVAVFGAVVVAAFVAAVGGVGWPVLAVPGGEVIDVQAVGVVAAGLVADVRRRGVARLRGRRHGIGGSVARVPRGGPPCRRSPAARPR